MLRDYNYKRESLSREIINQILHLVCLSHLTKLGEMQVPCTAVRKEKHGLCIIEEYMADPSAQCLRTVVRSQQKPTVGKTEVGGQIWRG